MPFYQGSSSYNMPKLFCDELLEAAYDCSDFETAKIIAKKGYDIAVTLFGTNHAITTKWKSKL